MRRMENWPHGIGVLSRLRVSERKRGVSSSSSTCREVMVVRKKGREEEKRRNFGGQIRRAEHLCGWRESICSQGGRSWCFKWKRSHESENMPDYLTECLHHSSNRKRLPLIPSQYTETGVPTETLMLAAPFLVRCEAAVVGRMPECRRKAGEAYIQYLVPYVLRQLGTTAVNDGWSVGAFGPGSQKTGGFTETRRGWWRR